MSSWLDLIDTGNLVSGLFLVGLLTFVGNRVSESHLASRTWGKRLACLALLLLGLRSLWVQRPTGFEELVTAFLRSLLGAGLVLGTAWIVLPAAAFLYSKTIGTTAIEVRRFVDRHRRFRAERRHERQVELERRRQREEYDRRAPERERQQREADGRRTREAEEQLHREDLRAECEVLFTLHAPDIADRFNRQAFDAFVQKHLNDRYPLAYVEQRAQQLRSLIQQHVDKVSPPPKFRALEDVVVWFNREKNRLESLPDDKTKRTLIARLNARYDELTARVLEEMD